MTTSPLSKHRRWWWLLLAGGLAYGGLLFDYAHRLWLRDYFQFYPVFLVAVGALTVSRLRISKFPKQTAWRIQPVSLLFSVAALVGCVWGWSPWLAAFSALLLVDSLLCVVPWARRSWRLLGLLIILPMRLDEYPIHWLQKMSSANASLILDRLDVPHLMRGNVLELPDKRLFVEEACSGISSVYLLLAVAALYVVWERVRLVRALPLLLSVAWWAAIANIIRLCTIVAGLHFYNLDMSSGWQHETLGIVVLLLALLGLYGTNGGLKLLLDPIDREAVNEKHGSLTLTPVRLWNLLTKSIRQTDSKPAKLTMTVSRRRLLNGLTCLLFVSGTYYWASVAMAAVSNRRFEVVNTADQLANDDRGLTQFHRLSKDTLNGIPEIQVTEFRNESRSAIDKRRLFGANSSVWELDSIFGKGLAAIDGPFDGWHDLRMCYEGLGWKFEQTTVHSVPGQPSGRNLVTVRMIDVDGQRAHLHFCLFDTTGGLLPVPIGDPQSSLVGRLQDRLNDAMASRSGVWWQMQLVFQRDAQSIDSEILAEHQVFGQFLISAQRLWKENPAAQVDSPQTSPQTQTITEPGTDTP